jgi:hypothetical protein
MKNNIEYIWEHEINFADACLSNQGIVIDRRKFVFQENVIHLSVFPNVIG